MAYDEALADRIRRTLGPRPDVTERKMFGGVAFLRDGKMFCGVASADLMLRVGPERYEAYPSPRVAHRPAGWGDDVPERRAADRMLHDVSFAAAFVG